MLAECASRFIAGGSRAMSRTLARSLRLCAVRQPQWSSMRSSVVLRVRPFSSDTAPPSATRDAALNKAQVEALIKSGEAALADEDPLRAKSSFASALDVLKHSDTGAADAAMLRFRVHNGMAFTLASLQETEEAARAFEANLERAHKMGDEGLVSVAMTNVASIRSTAGRFDDALPLLKQSQEIRDRLNEYSLEAVDGLCDLAHAETVLGHLADAQERLDEALRRLDVMGDDSGGDAAVVAARLEVRRGVLHRLLDVYARRESVPSQRVDKAAEEYLKLVTTATGGAEASAAVLAALRRVATVYVTRKQPRPAIALLERAVALHAAARAPSDSLVTTLHSLAMLQVALANEQPGDDQLLAQPEAHLREALRVIEAQHGLQSQHAVRTLFHLGHVLMLRRDWAAADTVLKRLLALYRKDKSGAAAELVAGVTQQLGDVAAARGQLNLAEHYYRQALAALHGDAARATPQSRAEVTLEATVYERLVDLYANKMAPVKASALADAQQQLARVRSAVGAHS